VLHAFYDVPLTFARIYTFLAWGFSFFVLLSILAVIVSFRMASQYIIQIYSQNLTKTENAVHEEQVTL